MMYDDVGVLAKGWDVDDDGRMGDYILLDKQEESEFWRKYKIEHPEMVTEERNNKINLIIDDDE